MTNKTMPERIFACRDTVVDAWGGTVEEGWHTAPQFDEEVEYVRADIAASDAKVPLTDCQNDAVSDVINERQKQIAKGYDAAHDDADMKGNHARAGSYYAAAARGQRCFGFELVSLATEYADNTTAGYPWARETKAVEADPRSNLVKAAALLIAEIERIDREGASE